MQTQGPATTTTTAGIEGTTVSTAADINMRPGSSADTRSQPTDTLIQRRSQILSMFGEVVPGQKCQPANTDVLLSTDVGRVSTMETGSVSVRRGVIRQKEEENNTVVQQTTSKVSPVVHNTNVVVDSIKNIGRMGVKQLSERFNALAQERDDTVSRRPGHVKRVWDDDDVKLGMKKMM